LFFLRGKKILCLLFLFLLKLFPDFRLLRSKIEKTETSFSSLVITPLA